jgi:hypothetical protein
MARLGTSANLRWLRDLIPANEGVTDLFTFWDEVDNARFSQSVAKLHRFSEDHNANVVEHRVVGNNRDRVRHKH